ncbi:MAG: TlpA disulfide reductase family protein [Ginsengibacter sp.]
MKKQPLFILFVLFSMISTAFAQNSTIHGSILHSADPDLKINIPVDGKFFEGANITTAIDATTGEFQINFEIKQSGFITLVNNWRSIKLFVVPGKTYEIEWDMKTRSAVKITGYQSEGQMMLQQLALGQNAKRLSAQLDSLKTVKERCSLATKIADEKIARVKSIYKQKKISKDFYRSTLNLIEVDRINSLSTNFFFEYRKWEGRSDEDLPKMAIFFKEFMPAWSDLYKRINNSNVWLKSSAFTDLLGNYKFYLNLADSGRLVFGRGNYARLYLDEIKHTLKGEMKEYAWGNLIVVGVNQKEYEKEWIQNFEDFKKKFPKSSLIPYLTLTIQKVIDYQAQLESQKDPDVIFIKNYEQINEFSQLLAELKGKVTYIDLWATWCVPCREELQYSIAMHQTLEDLGVQSLYLSLDKDNAHDKWYKMVYGLGLKGLNMRVNSTLHEVLNKTIPQFYGIPRYLIVDKEGKVVEWNAKRPSDQLLLIEQLKKYL